MGEFTLPENKLFLNNEFVDAKSTKRLTVYNPVDGSVVSSSVPCAGEEDVDLAVKYAMAAGKGPWKKYTNAQRIELLNKIADILEKNADEFAYLTRITLGAPKSTFGAFEVKLAAGNFRYFAGWVDKFAGESYPADDGLYKIVRREPLGVCAGIVPWNGPLATLAMKVAPALAVGNTFICKPSEKTPFAAMALGKVLLEAGCPPGVVQVLPGDGSTGALLSAHMQVKKVSFTGSVPTGRKIQQLAASSNLKRLTLELGGKSPAVVFDDANLDNAVAWIANSITANTGQICFAPSRAYVQEGIANEFMEAIKKVFEEKRAATGDPNLETTQVGPLVDQMQFDRVSGFITRGQSQGKLVTGGARIGEKGFYLEPTIFSGTKADAEIERDEIFGPVIVINTFKTEEEVLERSNESDYGLMAGVFTRDINRALRVSSELDSGTVGINCISLTTPSTPFGGTKTSGIGRECGHWALAAYTEPKTVLINMNS